MIIVIMGVSGVGKTTIGQQLAQRLGCRFSDADQFHSSAAIAKMHAGSPLTDADREPWLARMRRAIEDWRLSGDDHVLACSALKLSYRIVLRQGDADVQFVYLKATRNSIEARLHERNDHFFDPKLLDSQFADLEEPRDGEALVVDAQLASDVVVDRIVTALAQDSGEY